MKGIKNLIVGWGNLVWIGLSDDPLIIILNSFAVVLMIYVVIDVNLGK